jgi:hypothetical protein
MSPPVVYLLLGSFAMGLLGAVVGTWVLAQRVRAQLAGQLQAAGMPQMVQQAIQIELEFLSRRQTERDEAHAQEQQRWQAGQDERLAEVRRVLLQALAAQAGKSMPSAVVKPAAPAPIASARPPELMSTPLPRPQPVHEPEPPALELSDEELDALPPELPASAKPRKRMQAAPKKPVMRDL